MTVVVVNFSRPQQCCIPTWRHLMKTNETTANSVRLSAAAQAALKQESLSVETNATSNIVHAVRFR